MKFGTVALIGLIYMTRPLSAASEHPTVEISNNGEISIDQDSGLLQINGDVEIHQPPYYVFSDQVSWNQATKTLQSKGDVRLVLAIDEAKTKDYLSSFNELNEDSENRFYELLTTESLSYNTDTRSLTPDGLAKVQFGIARIIGHDFNFELEKNRIHTGNYRVGMNALFLEGNELVAQGNQFHTTDAHFYLGEPQRFSLQGHINEVNKESDEHIAFKGVWLKIGPVPIFYLPYYKHNLTRKTFSVSGKAGYSGDVGPYIELRPTYHPNEDIKLFGDLNFYRTRGVMFGPGFELEFQPTEHQQIQTSLESGYIRDNGHLGTDLLDRPIDEKRHFIDFEYTHNNSDNIQILGKYQRWSDSEILRDFDTGEFRKIQQPESFFEANWVKNNFAFKLTTTWKHEDFEYATERSPEYTFQLLPSPIGKSGLYQSALFSGSHAKNDDPNRSVSFKYNRYRTYYELLYPKTLNSWLDFTPLATAHTLSYHQLESSEDTINSYHMEIGFDLNAHIFGEWKVENDAWNIYGIRHQLMPTIQFRHVSKSDSNTPALYHAIEQEIFHTGLQDIDLSAHTHLDDLTTYSTLRVGIANRIISKKRNGELKQLLKWDLFHDTYWRNDNRFDDQSLLISNIRLNPAYWLKLDLQTRFDTNRFEMNDTFGRLHLIDGDIWTLALSGQFLKNSLEQYQLNYKYKLTENIKFVSSIGYDTKQSRFYEQLYGFQFAVANYWDLFLSVRIREGSSRNNKPSFELKILSGNF